MANASGQRLTKELDRRPLMAGAEPIYIDQGEAGFLFLHGFTGSPYEARDLANYFSRKGYAVWAPLLPGHGTSPEDLENIAYTEWLDAAEQSYMEMKARYPKVYVCGQSMGGALALHIAANHPVDAVITFAAAIIMKDWRLALLPLAKKVLRYQYKSKGPDIRSAEAKARSASYPRYPISSLIEFLKLIEQVREELPRVTSPALIIHSRRDHTITPKNLDYIARNISSAHKQTLLLEASYHVITVDVEKERIFEAVEQFVHSLE